MTESFLKRKLAKRESVPTLKSYGGPTISVEHPLPSPHDIEASSSEEVREAIAKIKENSLQYMAEQIKDIGIKIDDASIKAAIEQYEKEPGIREETVRGVRTMMSALKGSSPEEIFEKLANDARAVCEAAENDIEIPLNNVLIPLLRAQGDIEQKALDEASKKNLRGVRLSTRKLKTGALGAIKIATSRASIPSAIVVHLMLGIVDTAVVEKAAEGVLSDWAVQGATKTVGAWSAAIAGNALLVKQKLSVRPEWIRGTADLFWGDTKRQMIFGGLTAASLALMTPAILGNVKRGTVDSAVSGEVGTKMKAQHQKDIDIIRETIAKANNLFSTIQPSIDRGMKNALKEGGIGWGERTWSRNRIYYGKNKESDDNLTKFKANPADDTATFRGEPLSKFAPELFGDQAHELESAANSELVAAEKELAEAKQKYIDSKKDRTPGSTAKAKAVVVGAELKVTNAKKKLSSAKSPEAESTSTAPAPNIETVETAIQNVNKKYGLQPTDGAQQYLEKLTGEINTLNTEQVFTILDSLLKESDTLSKSGILGNIFGILAPVPRIVRTMGSNAWEGKGLDSFTHDVPWDEMFHSSSGVRALFKSEENYLGKRNELAKQLKKFMVGTMLAEYLDDVSRATDISAQINVPPVTFNIYDNATGIDKAPYKVMIDKSVMDYAWPIMPPDDSEEWKHIAAAFKNSDIDWIDVSTTNGRLESMTLLVGFVLMLLAGSVWYTILMKKLNKRWGIKDALRDDEKNGLFAVESKIAQDMVKLIQDREKNTLGIIAKSGLEIPQRDEIALGAILQRRLREHTLSLMTPPLDKTPEGIAFINRENSLGSRKLRHTYAAKLNELIDNYKNERGRVVTTLLDDIDEGRYEELKGLQGFVTATQPYASNEATRQNIKAWWERIDTKFVKEEIEARKANVQNIYAEREALLTLREPIRVHLEPNIPDNAISPADIVATSAFAELDSLIAVQHEAIERISNGAITGRVERDKNVVFSSEQIQELMDKLQEKELSNKLNDMDITSIATEYSALVQGLGKRVGSLEPFVATAFGEQASGGRISFDFAYRPDLSGPTIEINLQRSYGETLVVPFRQTVPNRILSSDEAIVSSATQWLKPDSPEIRLMRLYSVYDSYTEATEAIKEELLENSTNAILAVETLDEQALSSVQQLIKRSEVSRIQKQLIDQIEATGDSLNQVQQRVFEEPDQVSLGGMWKKDIRAVFKVASNLYSGATLKYDAGTEEIIVIDSSGERRVSVRNISLG